MTNPFAEGENRILRPPATAMVIFGASGDLTHRKLIPALYNLAHDDFLPSSFMVIGVSRSQLSDDQFRENLKRSLQAHSRREVSAAHWEAFSKNVFYQPLDATKPEDFVKLKSRLEQLAAARGEGFDYLYYLATAPTFFGLVAENLRKAGLVEPVENGSRKTALVVEKPFGDSYNSAQELNRVLLRNFDERQIFRIDHYLGKETVQNILVFRFANGIFEPLWNRHHVDCIQISVCESIGVEARGSFFDQTGILRDIVQNHLLQMLALLCIEPPISLSDPDSIRDEKVKVLRAIRRLKPNEVKRATARAQYKAGWVEGQEVLGYPQEPGIPADSETETYAALRLEIDNWRWFGVPIYIRAGKRLPKRVTEITIFFKKPPETLFRGRQVDELEQNVLAIQVQPNEGVSLKISSKPPGPRLRVRPVVMDFTYGGSFGVPLPEAYERLLLDAMKGDATLFTRDDEIEQAWDVLTPILEAWRGEEAPALYEYEAGTWGPKEADRLMVARHHRWRRL